MNDKRSNHGDVYYAKTCFCGKFKTRDSKGIWRCLPCDAADKIAHLLLEEVRYVRVFSGARRRRGE